VIVVILVCIALAIREASKPSEHVGVEEYMNSGGDLPVREQPKQITASELAHSYRENEVRSDRDYKGRVLEVSGEVRDFSTTGDGKPVIHLLSGTRLSLAGVRCVFPDSSTERIARMSKGETVRIIGKCNGRSFGDIELADCAFGH